MARLVSVLQNQSGFSNDEGTVLIEILVNYP